MLKMDEKTSSNHVAELLKQLEELKKKKAHKERKLMKLKSNSFKDSSKERCPDASSATSGKKHDSRVLNPAIKDESYTSPNHIENYNRPCNRPDKSNEFHEFACPKDSERNDRREQTEENFDCKTAVVPANKSEFENSSKKSNFQSKVSETNERISFNTEIFHHEAVIHTGSNVEKSAKVTKIASTSQTVLDTEVIFHKKLSNELPLDKNFVLSRCKSPDLIDDSLNSDMSCFILVDEQQKKFGNDYNNICESIENKCSKQTTAEKIDSDLKISPPFSLNPSSNESQQANGVFNFPKFSTPTDVDIYQSGSAKNMLDNLLDKCETQKTSVNVNDPADNVGNGDSLVTEDIHSIEDVPESNVAENKQNLQLNCILGSGLSSMLDACYGSPVKESIPNCENFPSLVKDVKHCYSQNVKNISKKRKLLNDYNGSCSEENLKLPDQSVPLSVPNCDEFNENEKIVPFLGSNTKLNNNSQSNLDNQRSKNDYEVMDDELDFDNSILYSNPFTDSQNVDSSKSSSSNEVSSQVTKAVDGLIAKVCEDISNQNGSSEFSRSEQKGMDYNENITFDSEVLIVPETEGLGLYFSKDSEDFLDTSTLSQSFRHFETNNLLNMSSQSKFSSPVVNNIVSALKSSKGHSENGYGSDIGCNQRENRTKDESPTTPKRESLLKHETSCPTPPHDSVAMDTSFLEDDTQELGKLMQVPYMTEENVQENSVIDQYEKRDESTLKFTCSLHGAANEPVLDAEIVLFNDVKYAFLQHRTQIHVWRQEKAQWAKIFHHSIEEVLSLDKVCISRDTDNLVIVMLLSGEGKCCLQFLLFEKDARVIKLMENTHWLEERPSKDQVLLCGLDGLMFATAQCNEGHEVSLHAFISLKENPRLMTAVLGSTDSVLYSLCKIDKLPNALMGINDSMLYIWHVLEARLVTAVSLHPHDYLPIQKCFWATVEKGLIYFMTTCEGAKDFQVCQLLAANLATGFCQSAMTYTTLPSKTKSKVPRITKAAYLEPFLVVAHSRGALLWSVTEEFCCAALSTQSEVTTVAISKDVENWGLLAVGNNVGCINCYSLN